MGATNGNFKFDILFYGLKAGEPQSNSLSDSGRELVIDELVDVIVVSDWLFGCFPYWTAGLPSSKIQ